MDADESEEPAGLRVAEWKAVFLRGAERGEGKTTTTHKFESITAFFFVVVVVVHQPPTQRLQLKVLLKPLGGARPLGEIIAVFGHVSQVRVRENGEVSEDGLRM